VQRRVASPRVERYVCPRSYEDRFARKNVDRHFQIARISELDKWLASRQDALVALNDSQDNTANGRSHSHELPVAASTHV
jgi:hypothetical protein